jgi:hypothetical protein
MRATGAIVRVTCAASLAAAVLSSSSARAQAPSSSNDKVAAEALFEDARRMTAAGNYADACPKFADSQRLDPSAGTLLNLASCYEKAGRTATAWATYREAASAANATGRTEYVTTAQRHAEALAPHLARLTVTVTSPADGMRVMRDGSPVERSEWGIPIPIDPGSHTLEASAPGHKPWSGKVDVPANEAQVSATVPVLEAAPVEATPPPVVAPPPPAPAPVTGPPSGADSEPGRGNGQRILGIVVGAAGVVGLGLGGAFAVIAKNQYSTSLGNCQTGNPDLCNGTGVSQRNSARSDGNIASIAVSAGAAALVGGVVIWLTAPRSTASASLHLAVAPTLGGGVLQGVW